VELKGQGYDVDGHDELWEKQYTHIGESIRQTKQTQMATNTYQISAPRAEYH
jgi:hypothetical protein